MTIFSGEICAFCGRPITVDDKNPQLARCRKCSAPHHTQCWFAADEKCAIPACDGKASDIAAPKIKDTVGEICPFLPFEEGRREGGDPSPAKCVKGQCMLYDAVERRCSLGEIAYALATVRQSGRQTRHLMTQAVGSATKQQVTILTAVANSLKSVEREIKGLGPPQEKSSQALEGVSGHLKEIRTAIEALSGDQQAAKEGFERLAGAVEASGVGEQVRGRREARLAARAALRDGRPGAAVRLLQQAERRSPDEAVLNDLATAFVHQRKPDEAKKVLEKVLNANPDYTQCRITLAALLLEAGEAQEAEALLKDAPKPPNPQLRAELAYAQACVAYAVGHSEDAVGLLNQALDEDPWHAPAAAALSDLRARRMGEPVPDAAGIALQAAGMKAEPNHG
ncbi:MAG: tetratricopeptide repeat protein [Planctomycetota bacterium]